MGQVEHLPLPPGFQAGKVEAEGAGAQQGGAVHGPGAAEDGLHAGDEFKHGEGLHQVVVGPQAQALHPVRLLAAGREHEDGHLIHALPEGLQDLEPVELGQHQVQHDEIGPPGRMGRQGWQTVAHGLDGVAFKTQVVDEELAEGRLILHHEDVGHGVSLKDRATKVPTLSWNGKGN